MVEGRLSQYRDKEEVRKFLTQYNLLEVTQHAYAVRSCQGFSVMAVLKGENPHTVKDEWKQSHRDQYHGGIVDNMCEVEFRKVNFH